MVKNEASSTVESRRLPRNRALATFLAAGLLATVGCSSDGKGEGGATNSPGVTTEASNGGRGGETRPEGPLECPTVTAESYDGNLTAHAVAVGEVSANDFFGLTAVVGKRGSPESTAWFAQFGEDGTAEITIPEQTTREINNYPGSRTRTYVVRSDGVTPPEETLTSEGMPGADALMAMNEKIARTKGIEDYAEQIDEFPEQLACGGATLSSELTWHADRPEEAGPGLGEPTNNPFAPLPDSMTQD